MATVRSGILNIFQPAGLSSFAVVRKIRRATAVEFGIGKGEVVMFGFGVQHRAQTEGTFKMLFNAIQQAGYAPVTEKAAGGQ